MSSTLPGKLEGRVTRQRKPLPSEHDFKVRVRLVAGVAPAIVERYLRECLRYSHAAHLFKCNGVYVDGFNVERDGEA